MKKSLPQKYVEILKPLFICQAGVKLTEHKMQYFWQCKIRVAKLKMLQMFSYNFVPCYAFCMKYFIEVKLKFFSQLTQQEIMQ